MRIWVPRTKIVEPRDPVQIVMRVGGRWKLDALCPGRYIRPLTGWFPNLITNGGLNRMGDETDYLTRCVVGTGNTTPQNTDTQLASLAMSTTSTWDDNANTIETSPPYFGAKIRFFEFSPAGSDLNLAEIGVGWSDTGLFSRALILDGMGSPTTITVRTGEILRATYELRLHPPTADVNDQISVEVDGSPVSTDIVSRACVVENMSAWALNTGVLAPPAAGLSTNQNAAIVARVYNGSLGAVDESPSGNFVTIPFNVIENDEYTPDSLFRDGTISLSTSQGNVSGGAITALRVPFGTPGNSFGGFGCFQMSFNPGIPKDDQRTVQIRVRHSWDRAA